MDRTPIVNIKNIKNIKNGVLSKYQKIELYIKYYIFSNIIIGSHTP